MRKISSYLVASLLCASSQAQEIMIVGDKAYPVEDIEKVEVCKNIGESGVSGVVNSKGCHSLFDEALKVTGLADSLTMCRDLDYDDNEYHGASAFKCGFNCTYPSQHLYGYTLFVETDSVYEANGLKNLDDLRKYAKKVYDEVYPNDANVKDETNRRNSLNRFVAYHILDRMIKQSDFIVGVINQSGVKVNVGCCQYVEHYETMNNTLLKIYQRADSNYYLNAKSVFNLKNGKEITKDSETGVPVAKAGKDNCQAVNGYVYSIHDMLVYDTKTKNMIENERIRMDLTYLTPEFQTNELKLKRNDYAWVIPNDYLRNVRVEGTMDQLYWPNSFRAYSENSWTNLHTDEMMYIGSGKISIRLPRVPKGKYELRMATYANNNRPKNVTFSINDKVVKENVDLSASGLTELIGGTIPKDTSDDEENLKTDKELRSHGIMKAPNIIPILNNNMSLRDQSYCYRLIICEFESDGESDNWLNINVLGDKASIETYLDYIELCPESIYNNSSTPEDIW